MKTKIKKVAIKLIGMTALIVLSSFTGDGTKTENSWKAPNEANELVNPMNGNVTASLEGKKIFNQMCSVCHGEKGKGDGIAGAGLTPHPANFTSETICSETDGAIFWKMTTGKAPMASYKTILTEEKRWQLVTYIRQLQANSKPKIN